MYLENRALRLLLVAHGVLVIGLVDSVLRPLLIGKDRRMLCHVVMITTSIGIAAAMFIAIWHVCFHWIGKKNLKVRPNILTVQI